MQNPGVYILIGPGPNDDDDLPTLYIGHAGIVRARIESHDKEKIFGIVPSSLFPKSVI